MRQGLRHLRKSSFLYLAVGALLVYWGFAYSGETWSRYVPPLTAKYQMGQTISGFGALIIGYGLVTLFRHKGDYDDFEKPGEVSEDDHRQDPDEQK